MINSRISELAAACDGVIMNVNDDYYIQNIVINDREVKDSCCYCALKGERFDGCDFVPLAVNAGAKVILTERTDFDKRYPLIVVKDARKALLKAARYYREKEIKRLYAVSGSVGKTTVKDMIYSILRIKGNAFKTMGNRNNLIGAPLTLLSNTDSEIAVVEAGISLPGEMDILGEMLAPDVAVITNIENMHIETLGSKENIAAQKLRLLSYLKPNGKAVLLYDEPLLRYARHEAREVVYVSAEDKNADFTLSDCSVTSLGTRFSILRKGKLLYKDLFIPLIGKHNALNALLALGAVYGDASEYDIRAGLENVEISDMRQKVLEIKGNKVLLDAYNAGPASCRSALSTFKTLCEGEYKRKILVFGSMLELGRISESEHYALGKAVDEMHPDALIVYGNEAEPIVLGAEENGLAASRIFYYPDEAKEEAINKLAQESEGGAVILLKGSRAMRMEEFIDKW